MQLVRPSQGTWVCHSPEFVSCTTHVPFLLCSTASDSSSEIPDLVDDIDTEGEEDDVCSVGPTVVDAAPAFQDLSDSKFTQDSVKVAGNISRQEFRSFWVNDLKADIWTMNLIQVGYKLPFSKPPGQYQERNNKSARQEKPYLIASVASLKDRGVVKNYSVDLGARTR